MQWWCIKLKIVKKTQTFKLWNIQKTQTLQIHYAEGKNLADDIVKIELKTEIILD